MSKNYIDRRVKIVSTQKSYNTPNYSDLINREGTVKRGDGFGSGRVGVLVDGKFNKLSGYGVYWLLVDELEFLDGEMENNEMKDFEFVAIVNIVEDYNKKDYAFALYNDDMDVIINMKDNTQPVMAVVNAKNKNNRVLGTIKEIHSSEEYFKNNKNTKITAEVVGVVNMDRYIARENEKVRLAELAKKKAAIERELEAEINKRKSVEYYEEMAKKYSDNPKLAELVAELKGLGE